MGKHIDLGFGDLILGFFLMCFMFIFNSKDWFLVKSNWMFLEQGKVFVVRKNCHYWAFSTHLKGFFGDSFDNLKFMIWDSSKLKILSLNLFIQNCHFGVFQELNGWHNVDCGGNWAPFNFKIGSELLKVFLANFDEGVFSNFGNDFFLKKLLNVPNFAGVKINKKIFIFLVQKVLLLWSQYKVVILIGFTKTNFQKRLDLLPMDLS